MKRFLNLNSYGTRSLVVIGFFLIIVPGISYLGSQLVSTPYPMAQFLIALAKISALVGAILLAAFIILLALEQVQDGIIFRQYRKQRGKKLPISDGLYECQFCGCRTVREFDAICPVCGKRLE